MLLQLIALHPWICRLIALELWLPIAAYIAYRASVPRRTRHRRRGRATTSASYAPRHEDTLIGLPRTLAWDADGDVTLVLDRHDLAGVAG